MCMKMVCYFERCFKHVVKLCFCISILCDIIYNYTDYCCISLILFYYSCNIFYESIKKTSLLPQCLAKSGRETSIKSLNNAR